MDETRIPTMSFRWRVPSVDAYSAQPNCARLQQLFETPRGRQWVDVPMVAVPEALSTPLASEGGTKP